MMRDSCLLEQFHRQTVEQGGRVRDHLRDGVEKALTRFGKRVPFPSPQHSITCESAGQISRTFRVLPAAPSAHLPVPLSEVSEERNLITDNMQYREYYSISRIRRLAEVRAAYTDQEDLWLGLATSFKLFQDEILGPPALGSDAEWRSLRSDPHIRDQ